LIWVMVVECIECGLRRRGLMVGWLEELVGSFQSKCCSLYNFNLSM
jgi:hypothetical protein